MFKGRDSKISNGNSVVKCSSNFNCLKRLQILTVMLLVLSYTCSAASPDSLKYMDATNFPVIGKGFTDTQTRYERLPARLEKETRGPVWHLSKNCSGLAIRFRTNSSVIAAKWEVKEDVVMNHFTMTGIKGLDLYCLKDGEWQFVNSARPKEKFTEAVIINNMSEEEKEYMLYLPLYDGLISLEIGVQEDAELKSPQVNSPKTGKPVVFYGTSITQGGCASRAGMSYTNILSRMLDREIINLGFSGNGRLDLEIAEAMTEIDASCFVIDCLPNVDVEAINDRYVKFLKIIRQKHPKTPIIMVENIMYPHMYFDLKVFETITGKNKTVDKIYQSLKKKGDKNLYYVKADKLIGDHQEATVDGVHLTDLGFLSYAEQIYPVLHKRIKNIK